MLERFRADDFVANFQGAIDGVGTTEQLEHIATLIPDEWLAPMATGSPEQCVAAVRNQLALGCDGVILHGATPTELAPVIDGYAAARGQALTSSIRPGSAPVSSPCCCTGTPSTTVAR